MFRVVLMSSVLPPNMPEKSDNGHPCRHIKNHFLLPRLRYGSSPRLDILFVLFNNPQWLGLIWRIRVIIYGSVQYCLNYPKYNLKGRSCRTFEVFVVISKVSRNFQNLSLQFPKILTEFPKSCFYLFILFNIFFCRVATINFRNYCITAANSSKLQRIKHLGLPRMAFKIKV